MGDDSYKNLLDTLDKNLHVGTVTVKVDDKDADHAVDTYKYTITSIDGTISGTTATVHQQPYTYNWPQTSTGYVDIYEEQSNKIKILEDKIKELESMIHEHILLGSHKGES